MAALSFVCHPVADVPRCFFRVFFFFLKDQSLKLKDEDDILQPFTEPFKWLTLTFAFVR